MAEYVAQTFTGQRVYTDGNTYVDCDMRGCALVYGGGEPPKLTGCNLQDVHLEFDGAALRTVSFMGAILAPVSPLKGLLAYLPAHIRGG
jgi:hypothetical protein